MFVECSTTVEAGVGEVENSLDRLRENLETWADIAYRDGEQLRSRVGPGGTIAREVQLEIGSAEIQSAGIVYPIHWTASAASILFPELDADLILSKIGSHRTRLTLRGTYRPPLGPLGRLADRAVLSGVAEATVADWVNRLTEALNSESQQV